MYYILHTHSRRDCDEPFRTFQADRRRSPREAGKHPVAEWPGLSALWMHRRPHKAGGQETPQGRLEVQRWLRAAIQRDCWNRNGRLAPFDPYLADGVLDPLQREEGCERIAVAAPAWSRFLSHRLASLPSHPFRDGSQSTK